MLHYYYNFNKTLYLPHVRRTWKLKLTRINWCFFLNNITHSFFSLCFPWPTFWYLCKSWFPPYPNPLISQFCFIQSYFGFLTPSGAIWVSHLSQWFGKALNDISSLSICNLIINPLNGCHGWWKSDGSADNVLLWKAKHPKNLIDREQLRKEIQWLWEVHVKCLAWLRCCWLIANILCWLLDKLVWLLANLS